MLSALLMQMLSLLPPTQEVEVELDPDYREAVVSLAKQEDWPRQALATLHARGASQEAVLMDLVARGNDAEIRLAAVLGAGVEGTRPLATAFWRRAGMDRDEARVIACLLAPQEVPSEALPLLAWIATDPRRSLPQRATACARLLDADCLGAWPTVRALLRAGTRWDVRGPEADWKRGGRYELPKRILLLSIQDLLQRNDLAPTAFEPNSAWDTQLEQLADLELQLDALRASAPALQGREEESWPRLEQLLEDTAHRDQAHRALQLLGGTS